MRKNFLVACVVISAIALFLVHPRLSHANNESTILNRCNSALISSPVNANATIAAFELDGFAQVTVFDNFSGTAVDANNQQYSMSGSSSALYNTPATFYDLPTLITFKGLNGAPSFTVLQHTQVSVDALNSQKPVAIGANNPVTSCLEP